MMRSTALALWFIAAVSPALADGDDVPDPRYPGDEVVSLDSVPPEFRRAGTGHIRLVYEDNRTAARLNANELYAYEEAYNRALTALSMRMPVDRAQPLARQAAWDAVVGRGRVVGTVRSIPRTP